MPDRFLKTCWGMAPVSIQLLYCRLLLGLAGIKKRLSPRESDGLVYVCGPFASYSGIGEGARLYAAELEETGGNAVRIDLTRQLHMSQDREPLPMPKIAAGPGTVVIHANPPHFQLALHALGEKFLREKKIVGYWAWELEEFPEIWKQALQYVDAVETPSSFIKEALERHTAKPVNVHAHHIGRPARRKEFFSKDGILRCLYIFDAGSSFDRKDPFATLEAFKNAFTPGEALLTIKACHADSKPKKMGAFAFACANEPDVKLITQPLNAEQMEELYLSHDVYLSLHRSEGFGLTIFEAMNYGLHVVATGWSGNMDFFSGELAYPVPFKLVPVKFATGPEKGLTSRWAEPDIESAATILRELRSKLLGAGHKLTGKPYLDAMRAFGKAL